MQEITEKHHITEEMWSALEQDSVSPKDYMQILEHTKSCTWCADRMAGIFMQDAKPLVESPVLTTGNTGVRPPAYLTEQILERTRQMDVQAAATICKTSKRLQLLLYSLKVGTAVVFSILILGVTVNFRNMELASPEWQVTEQQNPSAQEDTLLDKMSQAADGVTNKMNDFANLILNGGKKK